MVEKNNRISVLIIASNLEINGISSVIMNYCTNIDLQKFMITIAAGKAIATIHRTTCERLNVEIVELPHRKKNTKQYICELNKLMGDKHFDIIHVHGNQASMAIELLLAACHGIKGRIAHSHNTTCASMKLHKMMKPLFNMVYTDGFACGELAGEWLFGNDKFKVIPNGFITEKFVFNSEDRNEVRNKLMVQESFILGHIGRINEQKNQTFLLEIFSKVAAKRNDTILLLVGTGPLLDDIKNKIKNHPYKERIILYGESTEPEKMYAAMDVFVFPSLYEGLPITLLEAQINGLPCVISDVITNESLISCQVVKLSLKESPDEWAKQICKTQIEDRKDFYINNNEIIKRFNIRENAVCLEEEYSAIYTRCYGKK